MTGIERIDLAPRVLRAALLALAAVLALELLAYFQFRQNPLERMQFGYARDAGFREADGKVSIRRSASRALWDQEYPLARTPGVARVMLVGDSILRGGSYEDSAAGQLRRDLAKCGVRAEVWNLASPGYGSQRKQIMVQKALTYSPDLIVYQANVTTEYEDSREWERKEQSASWHPSHWPDKLPFIGRLALSMNEQVFWKWLDREIRSGLDPRGADLEEALASKSDREHWMPLMMRNFAATVGLAKQAGVPLVVIARASLVGEAGKMSAEMTDFGLEEQIGPLAASEGFRLISTREVFAKGDARNYFFDGTHWSRAGHELMSEALTGAALDALRQPCAR